MSEDRFQELKEKYVSVLNVLNREKLHVEKMHVENNKLFIRAVAPSDEAKNKFWDAVKTANANYSQDFQADISVAPQQAPKPAPAPQGRRRHNSLKLQHRSRLIPYKEAIRSPPLRKSFMETPASIRASLKPTGIN